MKIKFNTNNDSGFIRTNYDVTVTDDNGNDISNEISKLTIEIMPDDIVRASCEFRVSSVETNDGNTIDITNIASASKELILKELAPL